MIPNTFITLNGSITMLFNEHGLRINLEDQTSSITFATIELTANDVVQAFSRVVNVPCSIEVRGLHKLGKKMIVSTLELEMPSDPLLASRSKEIAIQEAEKHCPEGWEFDKYFSSQGSFFYKDGKHYARCTIRKWVDIDE